MLLPVRTLFADGSTILYSTYLGGAKDDRGRVIGRQGRVAKAMRAVLAASRHGGDARLEIVD